MGPWVQPLKDTQGLEVIKGNTVWSSSLHNDFLLAIYSNWGCHIPFLRYIEILEEFRNISNPPIFNNAHTKKTFFGYVLLQPARSVCVSLNYIAPLRLVKLETVITPLSLAA